ncbi:hypothetical protein DAC15_55 [Bacteroides phage DAC15]|uniref:homing endonuclease n=1 Tax=Bacteroides phage DAC15 TaxID=2710495 RepID=UPI001BE6ED9A|nr:homing endonuclease [Bacteroides phage DAC15]QIN96234.1 hypothetical protein DAC15_55 [Bacteroides phage DAC15]
MWTVYRHITPSGKVYVGITSRNPLYRWNNGRGYFNSKSSPLKSSIIKYGWDNIKHEILFTNLEESRAKSLEVDLIRHYKNLGISINITDGGDGTVGITPWNKGIKVPWEKSNKLKGRKLTPEHKKKLSLAHIGKSPTKTWKLSDSRKEAIRIANTGRHKSAEEINRIREAFSKPVIVYTMAGDIVGRFRSGKEAADYLGCDSSGVLKCCRYKQKTCMGHIIRFEYDTRRVQT